MTETVAILGASKNQSRYAHKAQELLIAKGHNTVPINTYYNMVDGVKCYPRLESYPENINTITVYVRPSILSTLVQEIIQVSPYRVILNPGTENEKAIDQLKKSGVEIQIACTLVLLSTSQF